MSLPVAAAVRPLALSKSSTEGLLLLVSFGFLLVGASVYYFADRRANDATLQFNEDATTRDLSVFLVGYTLAFAAALVPDGKTVAGVPIRVIIAVVLVVLYLAYLSLSLRAGELADSDDMNDLHIGIAIDGLAERVEMDSNADHSSDPHLLLTALQTFIVLGLIVYGAHLFVDQVE